MTTGGHVGEILTEGEPLREVGRDEIYDALFEEIEKDGRNPRGQLLCSC